MLLKRVCVGVAVAVAVAFGMPRGDAVALQLDNVPERQLDVEISRFYQDPRVERIAPLFQRLNTWPKLNNPVAIPPIAGFVAALAQKHPGRIGQLLPAELNPQFARAAIIGLRLAGQTERAQALADKAGLKRELVAATFLSLPAKLENLPVSSADELDNLWGASFASGDPRYVRLILGRYAEIANRKDVDANDLVRTVLFIIKRSREKDLRYLSKKYSPVVGREVVLAATALWALNSNAEQHEFVERTVREFIASQAGKPAARALNVIRAATGKAGSS